MSHPVNDQIADQVSDQVCGMSDIQVLNQLLARGIESPMDAEVDKDPVSYTHLTLPTNREV